MNDGKISFCVIATWSSYTRPFFVRATSVRQAYQLVLEDPSFDHSHVSLKAHVLGGNELLAVLPNIKEVARAYWREATRSANDAQRELDFEDVWSEHGFDLADEDDR